MAHIKTQGVVLRETNYKEADKILTVLTAEGGKRTVKASGCRRKGSRLAAAAQLLVYSDMTLFEYRDRHHLNEADSLEQFWGVRQSMELLALCSYFAEVTELVAEEGVPQPELLSLLLNSMYALDKLNKPQELVKAAFELKLMCLVGYEPRLDGCTVCAAEGEPSCLHLSAGVLHCVTCRDSVGDGISMPLAPGTLEAMRHIVYGDPKRLFSFQLEEKAQQSISDVCEAYLVTQLERGFRTLDFYKRLLLMEP